ncbi:MAG: TraR/DksA family transcriptional regulator [Gammaproteobacteria bacterium]|nr:TraR/DksA family transcriptional regulator [Gammaproteobacteria bacterium]NNK97804.1 TraR/DksA family transcriptional regulator [Xanthomonadales bacterium]
MELSHNELRNLEKLLLERKNELVREGETGQQAEEVVELDQARVGRLSRMDAMQAQAMSLETGRRRRQHLLEVDAAIERIRSDEYGGCFECGEDINPKRLEADPVATLCIACAQALE